MGTIPDQLTMSQPPHDEQQNTDNDEENAGQPKQQAALQQPHQALGGKFKVWFDFYTGCSLNIVFFFEDFKLFQTLAFLCFLSVSVCVHTPGR